MFNLIAGAFTYGTTFGWLNLLLAAGNILPLYQHDGWKCGVVIMRALMRGNSQPAERVFTFSGGFVSLDYCVGRNQCCYVDRRLHEMKKSSTRTELRIFLFYVLQMPGSSSYL